MALQNLVVQCLTGADRTAATEILGKHGPVSNDGCYVYGAGDDADVKALESKTLIVEELPGAMSISWLEPESQDTAAEFLAQAEVDGLDDLPAPLRQLADKAPEVYVIQFKGPIRGEWSEKLKNLGVTIGGYVPDFAFKAALDATQLEQVERLPFVQRVVLYTPEHTLRRLATMQKRGEKRRRPPAGSDAKAQGGEVQAERRARPDRVTYELRCHKAENLPVIAKALGQIDGVSHMVVGRRRMRFDVPPGSSLIGELARVPQVSSVDVYRPPRLDNIYARMGIGVTPAAVAEALPWDGTGVIVAVADSGVDTTHPDLKQRVKQLIERVSPSGPNDPDGHGTHVCGTIAGDGTASGGELKGMAPGAELIVQSLRDSHGGLTGLPINLAELFQEAYDLGARIHNNSWGALAAGLYTLDAYEVDEFVYRNPDCLVVVAAGNAGAQDPGLALGRIGFNSLQSPAGAKNALTVGACCSSRADGPFKGRLWRTWPKGPSNAKPGDEPICGDMSYGAAYSSRGPTDDERIKPELLAPATVVLSTRSEPCSPRYPFDQNDKYHFMGGTSMAAPMVAGAAAIVREFYVRERQHQPSAALLKATLINGAVWIERDTLMDEVGQPNYHQGFGRLDLRTTLPVPNDTSGLALVFADVGRDSSEAVNKNSAARAAWRRTVHVAEGGPLRATLTWTDRPTHGLQQDLDLVIVTPSGARLLGNPNLTRGPWAKTDHRNNVEQIIVAQPEPGVYQVNVIAYNTLFENQGFALVVTGRLTSQLLP